MGAYFTIGPFGLLAVFLVGFAGVLWIGGNGRFHFVAKTFGIGLGRPAVARSALYLLRWPQDIVSEESYRAGLGGGELCIVGNMLRIASIRHPTELRFIINVDHIFRSPIS
jgi:hypothetical protein